MPISYVSTHEKLTEFCIVLFSKYGLSMEDSETLCKSLVSADMRGIRSHGIVRIELYLNQIKAGSLNPKAVISTIKDTKTTALLDGNHGLGQVISQKAVELARQKANESNVGVITVRNSNHFGATGYWSIKLAGNDMIGFVTTNVQPLVATPVGKTRLIGNNPISIAIPARKYPSMCLDFANGKMALGKIFEYQRDNKPFPEGCWLDENGNPTTDPHANSLSKFISLPFGEHKGFGIAVMVETVTSVLAGGLVAAEVPDAYEFDKKNSVSHSFFAIKIDAFCKLSEYKSRIEKFIEYLHESPTRNENDRVFYPGEIESINYAESLKKGIVISSKERDYLVNAADEVNLSVDPSVFIPKKNIEGRV